MELISQVNTEQKVVSAVEIIPVLREYFCKYACNAREKPSFANCKNFKFTECLLVM